MKSNGPIPLRNRCAAFPLVRRGDAGGGGGGGGGGALIEAAERRDAPVSPRASSRTVVSSVVFR